MNASCIRVGVCLFLIGLPRMHFITKCKQGHCSNIKWTLLKIRCGQVHWRLNATLRQWKAKNKQVTMYFYYWWNPALDTDCLHTFTSHTKRSFPLQKSVFSLSTLLRHYNSNPTRFKRTWVLKGNGRCRSDCFVACYNKTNWWLIKRIIPTPLALW